MANSTPSYSRTGAGAAHEELQVVTVCDLGAVDTSATVDLSKASIFKTTSVSGTITLTLANLAAGARARIYIKSAATAPTLTLAGVDIWFGAAAAPTFANSKTTMLDVVNDGTRVVGQYVVQA